MEDLNLLDLYIYIYQPEVGWIFSWTFGCCCCFGGEGGLAMMKGTLAKCSGHVAIAETYL